MGIAKLIKALSVPTAIGALAVLVVMERRRPLRKPVESTTTRTGRNLAIAGLAACSLYLVEKPVTDRLTRWVKKHRVGILNLAPLPQWLETAAAVVLLDYTLYIWHVLTHKVSFLWRFHVVHHADRDLDASTALRFHFGELLISIAWRSAQIVVIGVSTSSFKAWQAFLLPSVLFHHSNLRLPLDVEKKLSRLIMTPRLHGIHHSTELLETDSNWSSGLTVWDRLHGTMRTDVPQGSIVIGAPGDKNRVDVGLPAMLALPFNSSSTRSSDN
ncbi:MAG: sterol desaturase family protein [Acidobacteriota bacterium]